MIWRAIALMLLILFGAALVWFAGFIGFERAARVAEADPPASDGIVALTGGVGRVETALRLFAEGKAPRLLISGVGGGAGLGDTLRQMSIDPALLTNHVVSLGRAATDTVGNAEETAAWARQNDIHTLIVVTAGYHMPRALREIERELPGVDLRPVAVRPPALRGRDHAAALRLLAVEYDKLIVAWLGINRLPKGLRS